MIRPVDLEFRLYPLRFRFAARQPLTFPNGKAGNVFRGALGLALRDVLPDSAYAGLFEPTAPGSGPSGLEKRPRPFVLRASHLNGGTVPAGNYFHVDLHLFVTGAQAANAIVGLTDAFASLGERGLGAARTGMTFEGVTRIDVPESPVDADPMILSLAPTDLPCSWIRIDFLTPTELKTNGEIAVRPAFGTLFKRVRDRISTLSAFYGAGPLAVDFCGLGERAELVALTRCSLTAVQVERRSSRTGQTHPLGGFIGYAEYSGDLGEFLPWLRAAEWTGVGRQTPWGKGFFQVHVFPPATD